jgi:hypothetical protein
MFLDLGSTKKTLHRTAMHRTHTVTQPHTHKHTQVWSSCFLIWAALKNIAPHRTHTHTHTPTAHTHLQRKHTYSLDAQTWASWASLAKESGKQPGNWTAREGPAAWTVDSKQGPASWTLDIKEQPGWQKRLHNQQIQVACKFEQS